MTPPPPRSTLFPYTTLFRSRTALAALHEVARRDQMAADAAGDRRHHMRELDIELGGLERAFGLHFRGACRLQGLAALVDDGIGHGLRLVQRQGAVEFALGEFCL